MLDARSVKAWVGPNGTVELRVFNGAQGWHSGYLTPDEAKRLSDELLRVGEQVRAKRAEAIP
jgi:hypothetical protein